MKAFLQGSEFANANVRDGDRNALEEAKANRVWLKRFNDEFQSVAKLSDDVTSRQCKLAEELAGEYNYLLDRLSAG